MIPVTLGSHFRDAYYASRVWEKTTWLGHRVEKCPLDLWLYQELLCQHRPDVLLEAGTMEGGSALFFASVFDMLGHGQVWTIDPCPRATPAHPRIRYIQVDSRECGTLVSELAGKRVSVSLDSLHTVEHVAGELEALGPLTSPGQFLVLEDTYPFEDLVPLVIAFKERHPDFHTHPASEKFMASFNPGGWMCRD